jgi:hypothetical protein
MSKTKTYDELCDILDAIYADPKHQSYYNAFGNELILEEFNEVCIAAGWTRDEHFDTICARIEARDAGLPYKHIGNEI